VGAYLSEDTPFTKRQREELTEIINEAVRQTLKEEMDKAIESGRLSEAVSKYDEVQSGLININSADAKELKTLNGIGDARASAIITYREINGPFGSIDELMLVDGISESILNKIRENITI
ncbi:MAG: ComEA family DNA-binding protein, partial [Eubacteriales bacterium]|nr:ComEA family DNA-binding protein [Eubacteriales bacterium]